MSTTPTAELVAPDPMRPRDDGESDEDFLMRVLGNARVRFWVCPVDEHRQRDTVTVAWEGGIAHCTAAGCQETSQPSTRPGGDS